MEILLIDDDSDSRGSIAKFLSQLGHQVAEADSGEKGLSLLSQHFFPMVLSDIRMPGMSGLELLKAITGLPRGRDISVVLITAFGDMDSAISAFRAGVFDYLLKPVKVKELALITSKIESRHQLLEQRQNSSSQGLPAEREPSEMEGSFSDFSKVVKYSGLNKVGIFSESMLWVVKQAYMYNQDRSIPVLINGETGTGKEVIARIIHHGTGEGPELPFVAINCAAITPSLFESELFGYEAGAFTGGAARGQKGKCDLASGGTLFLDEISEIPLELQGKLLRAIQEKCYYRVGGLKEIQMDVRLVCSSNRDLSEMVEQGAFRKDLYYRLKVGNLVIPPLRQRREDILPLASLFLWEFSSQKGKRFASVGKEAARVLLDYNWPGNVRELRNLMEWVVFMYDELELQKTHLGHLPGNHGEPGQELGRALGQLQAEPEMVQASRRGPEREYSERLILEALEAHQGNKAETARYLGISRTTLYNYLRNIRK